MVAAIGRAIASKAAKKAAKGAARAKKTGDVATVARKRYYRSAERNLKKAEQSSGATRAKYRQIARQDFEDALATYDKSTTQKFSKPMQRLAREFGVDLEDARAKFKTQTEERVSAMERLSAQTKESALDNAEYRRQREARAVFNSPIGSRIIGGLSDIWRDVATVTRKGKPFIDRNKIFEALLDYFDVDNLADLLDKIEERVGDDLYRSEDKDLDYEVVKLKLQISVQQNALVA